MTSIALAAQLAEIRATVAGLRLDRPPVGIAADLRDLLAAYDALAEELEETRTLVGRQTAKLASAIADKVRAESRVATLTEAILAFEKSAMLALARAGRGWTG